MDDSPVSSSSSSSSSKRVYLVIIPLILLSGLLVVMNQKPSTSYSLPFLHYGWSSNPGPPVSASVAAGRPTADQSLVKDDATKHINPDSLGIVEASLTRARASIQEIQQNNETSYDPDYAPTAKHINPDNLDMVEAILARARASIQEARQNNGTSYDLDYVPAGPCYRSPNAFHRSYLQMEKVLKIYVYEEGDPPLFHYSKSLGILGIEGILIHQIEISKFRTMDPRKAHVYFVPLSVQSIATYAYVVHNRAWSPLQNIARDYIKLISTKYPYWNRTLGHDHFLLACHDWAPTISQGVPYLFKNSIRVLCNANTSEGFKPSVDVSLPEIYLKDGTMAGLIGGPRPSKRSVLVFYAGGVHGYIRQLLMDHWKDKDPDVQVHEYLPKNISYLGMFRKSKYCICPSGWEVASPRMVEALYTGCVPVLLKDGYAKPFDDVLDWSSFSVDIHSNQIADLKKILMAIPLRKYVKMHNTGVQVRRHFEVNFPPKRYDVFHMILHSIWLRRINIQLRVANER